MSTRPANRCRSSLPGREPIGIGEDDLLSRDPPFDVARFGQRHPRLTHQRLVEVDVAVDKTGNQHPVVGFQHLHTGLGGEVGGDFRDPAVADQHVDDAIVIRMPGATNHEVHVR